MNNHQVFATITKVDENDDGTIDVHGVASTETKDSQGEIVTKECMQDAIPDYFMHGTGALRAMHQPIAAGYVYRAEVNADGETEISAKVVDPIEILKVTTGTYKGFSIGGSKVPGGYDKVTKTINKIRLTEISLVDRPANPKAVITMWKGDDMGIQAEEAVVDVSVTKEGEEQINALADMINKGEISPARLVELASADIAKVDAVDKPVEVEESLEVDTDTTKAEETVIEETVIEETTEVEKVEETTEVEKVEETTTEDAVVAVVGVSDDIRKELVGATTLTAFLEIAKLYAPDINVMTEICERAGVVADPKAEVIEEIIKAATTDKQHQKKLQKMHDQSVELGAVCAIAAAKVDKADSDDAISKIETLQADIAKVTDERDSLAKRVKELEAQPAPSKIVLRTINKADDIISEDDQEQNDGPVMKADGTIDHEATVLQEIKKVHGTGGTRFLR